MLFSARFDRKLRKYGHKNRLAEVRPRAADKGVTMRSKGFLFLAACGLALVLVALGFARWPAAAPAAAPPTAAAPPA